jgi:hypothetical protein
MSQWTHVNGSIRIDMIRGLMPAINFKEVFKTADYDDDSFDDCNVPCGSEGSIDVSVWENPSDSAMSAYTVNFFGDLRDYDDENEIVTWFTKIVDGSGYMVRDAVMSIDTEGNDKTFYSSSDNGVIKIK